MCGASARTESSRCDHCGARLATIACGGCFGMMFQGTKFCPHCGAEAARQNADDATEGRPCPRCGPTMNQVQIGPSAVQECSRCDGIWVDRISFERICAEKEQQRGVLGLPSLLPTSAPQPAASIRYVPCPECRKLMNRVNFANCSGVIVDVCRDHGTWFDRDELRRIIEFIRAGGLDVSRERKRAELLHQEQRLRRLQSASARARDVEDRGDAVLAAGGLLGPFL